jgi:hypothetical protein
MEDEATQGTSTQGCSCYPCCTTMSSEETLGSRGWVFKCRLGSFSSGRLAALEKLIAEGKLWAERSGA